jgi:hypothetical protein
LRLSTKTPPLESCTKNLPSQLVSAAVTTPRTRTGMLPEAALAESASTSAAFVSGLSAAAAGKFQQTNQRQKADNHEAGSLLFCRLNSFVMAMMGVEQGGCYTVSQVSSTPSKEGVVGAG